jgi:hypothetical protein
MAHRNWYAPFPYAIPVVGRAAIFLVGWVVAAIGHKWIATRNYGPKEHYRRDRLLNTGRIIQFANAQVFGTPVFNYTRNFAYIWDEIKFPIKGLNTWFSGLKVRASANAPQSIS